ncbi:hypothetical protein P7H21_09755 [Paenibacillus larvae]|nr:hypothetical protein [Paenibacillus larvae]MDT2304194.1 hypothetical protein [Paenibacillus larvae]
MISVLLLDEYVNYLAEHQNDIPEGLLLITKAANAHGFSIDHILEQFPEPSLENDVNVVVEYHIEFYYKEGVYELNQQRFTTGLESILHCLSLSIPTKDTLYLYCVQPSLSSIKTMLRTPKGKN